MSLLVSHDPPLYPYSTTECFLAKIQLEPIYFPWGVNVLHLIILVVPSTSEVQRRFKTVAKERNSKNDHEPETMRIIDDIQNSADDE